MPLPPLSPVRPSAPIRIKYEKRLFALIDEMANSLEHWLSASYRKTDPGVIYGMDASPARIMQSAMRKLSRRWLRKFDRLAPKLADYFATDVQSRCDRSLAADLRKGGMTVRFKMTAAMRNASQAIVAENVSLIKSIPRQYMTGVETLVMQSVQTGRDLGTLTEELTKRHGITKRRAAGIALDQNNKATATLTNVRWLELGIEEATWLHSAGGKVPRPSHVAFSGSRYSVRKGVVLDPKEGIVWPGTAIKCRCVGKAVIPGLEGLT